MKKKERKTENVQQQKKNQTNKTNICSRNVKRVAHFNLFFPSFHQFMKLFEV